ncbi:hypothetical protein EVAR_9215_1 [Eumeta japonica]|uniref:FLYWCH-type domain-containing protein n=1 Tax=Eumeta variegata TaxID=151549 RepID=A0A4C1WMR3_EUMVA|nr:hypothetical protein EVAR_9215_1 [Eumeta japonica]
MQYYARIDRSCIRPAKDRQVTKRTAAEMDISSSIDNETTHKARSEGATRLNSLVASIYIFRLLFLAVCAAVRIQLDNGRYLVVFKGYPFYEKRAVRKGTAVICSCTRAQCNSYIHVDRDLNVVHEEIHHSHEPTRLIPLSNGRYCRSSNLPQMEFIEMANGKVCLYIDRYTFYQRSPRVWYCTNNVKCRSYTALSPDMRPLRMKIDHCHPPPKLLLNIFMTQRGKERLVYHDYTYYKQSRTRNGFRWGCTKNRWHRCKAYLHLADDLTIVRSNMEHTHSPHGTPLYK